MARIAVRRQRDLGDVSCNVTGLAIDAAVRSGKRIARLSVVIKAPPRPAVRVVAERTIRPQPALMMLVPVARRANQRGILEPQRAMTFLARYDGVLADERKSRDVMVEDCCAPPNILAMTSLATRAELAAVPIVLSVT